MKLFSLFGFIGNNIKLHSIFIVILLFFGSLLEMLGLSLILPLLSILTNTGDQNSYLIYLNSIINLDEIDESNLLIYISVLIASVFLFKNVFLVITYIYQLKFIKKFHTLLGLKLLNNYLSQSLSFFSDKNSSVFIRNISTDLTLLSYSLTNFALFILESLILIFIFILLLIVNFKVTVIVILIFTVFLIIYLTFTKKRINIWGNIRQNTENQKIKIIKETLVFIREIVIYKLRNYYLNLFQQQNSKFISAVLKHTFVQNLARLLLEVVAVIGVITLILFSNNNGMEPIELIPLVGLFAGAAFKILPSINKIITAYQNIKFTMPVIETFKNELELIQNKKVNPRIKSTNFRFKKNIKFKNVSFYHTHKKYIFEKINLEIKKGSFVVLKGESGVGKSTLLDLLAGFQVSKEGGIIIDDQENVLDILDIWQSLIGFAPQNNVILDTTLIQNIAIENKEIVDEKIKEALEISELNNIVKNLPDGVNTNLGEHGNKISGGQKQRIGIARTIYNDRDILLFDESTNALDSNTNIKILNNLKNYSKNKNKTIIFITHNDDIINFADQIIDLSNLKN